MKVRCVTINLKGVELDWFDKRFSALTDELKNCNPDVVCFQESTVRQDTPLYNQARAIGEKLGLQTTIFSPYGNLNEVVTRDQGGIAIAARWPACDVRNRRLLPGHLSGEDSRVAVFATFETPEGQFGVANTHLSWRPEEAEIRLVQTGLIVDELERSPWSSHGRFVLMGDFNAVDNEAAVKLVTEKMQDAYRECRPHDAGFTWSAKNPYTDGWNLPERRVDYIFCSKKTKVTGCEIVLNKADPVFPSDHFGVMADLEWA